MTYSAYLAGPIFDDRNASRWRTGLQEANNYGDLYLVDPTDLEEASEQSPEELVTADLEYIREVDGLIVHWKDDVQTAGTPMEIFYASYVLNKPVVVWYRGREENLPHWIRAFADEVVRNGNDALSSFIASL